MNKLPFIISFLAFMGCMYLQEAMAQQDSLKLHIDSLKMNLNPKKVTLDSLIMKNGDIIVGEMKTMDKGVLTVETQYSDKDFTITWIDIRQVKSVTRFLITLRDGSRMNSNIRSRPNSQIVLKNENGDSLETILPDIVYLQELESSFWSRINATLDVGINFTKDNNLRQYNFQSTAGYTADQWSLDLYFNDFRSSQDSIQPSERKEAGVNYKYFLKKDWYIVPQVEYLSNTEQALKSRITSKVGAGKFMFHTNKSYWGVIGGLNLNDEKFTNETENRNSAELFGGSELNMFDTGDLSLLSNIYFYPSLTEKGRFRTDFKVETKYEFVEDFYVKLSLTLNYDNQPAIQGNEVDYKFGFSVGFEL